MNLQEEEYNPPPTDKEFVDLVQTELDRSRVDVARLRDVCYRIARRTSSSGVVPELRGAIWEHLLGVSRKSTTQVAAFLEEPQFPDDDSQATIEKDVVRTRAALPFFQTEDKRRSLRCLLSFYCMRQNVHYLQGLNEIIAPFMLTGLSDGEVYNCFEKFVNRYLGNIVSEDHSFIQCVFALYRTLLLYHDPELALFLDKNFMSPMLYATPWFMTVFARNFTLSNVFSLWDRLLLLDDHLFLIFFCVGFIMSHRDTLLNANETELPIVLSTLTVSHEDGDAKIAELWHRAIVLDAQTPPSFRRSITKALFDKRKDKDVDQLVEEQQSSVSLHIPLRDVISATSTRSTSPSRSRNFAAAAACACAAGDPDSDERPRVGFETHEELRLQYIVLDCRSQAEFHTGRLPMAIHLDPDAMLDPEESQRVFDLVTPLKGDVVSHFCFFGSGAYDDDQFLKSIILQFLKRGFSRLSIIQGGYEEAYSMYLRKELDLCQDTEGLPRPPAVPPATFLNEAGGAEAIATTPRQRRIGSTLGVSSAPTSPNTSSVGSGSAGDSSSSLFQSAEPPTRRLRYRSIDAAALGQNFVNRARNLGNLAESSEVVRKGKEGFAKFNKQRRQTVSGLQRRMRDKLQDFRERMDQSNPAWDPDSGLQGDDGDKDAPFPLDNETDEFQWSPGLPGGISKEQAALLLRGKHGGGEDGTQDDLWLIKPEEPAVNAVVPVDLAALNVEVFPGRDARSKSNEPCYFLLGPEYLACVLPHRSKLNSGLFQWRVALPDVSIRRPDEVLHPTLFVLDPAEPHILRREIVIDQSDRFLVSFEEKWLHAMQAKKGAPAPTLDSLASEVESPLISFDSPNAAPQSSLNGSASADPDAPPLPSSLPPGISPADFAANAQAVAGPQAPPTNRLLELDDSPPTETAGPSGTDLPAATCTATEPANDLQS